MEEQKSKIKVKSKGPYKQSEYKWSIWEYGYAIVMIIFWCWFVFDVINSRGAWPVFDLFVAACMAAFLDREQKIRLGEF